MYLSPTDRFTKKGQCVTRVIADETILVPIRAGVGDLNAIYTFNDVGSFIWAKIDGVADIRQIGEAVTAEFEVGAKQAQQDTGEFLAACEAAGLIEPVQAD